MLPVLGVLAAPLLLAGQTAPKSLLPPGMDAPEPVAKPAILPVPPPPATVAPAAVEGAAGPAATTAPPPPDADLLPEAAAGPPDTPPPADAAASPAFASVCLGLLAAACIARLPKPGVFLYFTF